MNYYDMKQKQMYGTFLKNQPVRYALFLEIMVDIKLIWFTHIDSMFSKLQI